MKRETKTAVVKCRVTSAEKLRIQNAARDLGLTESDYLRNQLMIPRAYTKQDIRYIKNRINYEINSIGNNVNQIARKYNEYLLFGESKELMQKMADLNLLLKDINGKLI